MSYEVVAIRRHKINGEHVHKSAFHPVGNHDISKLRDRCIAGKCSLPTRRTITTDSRGVKWVKEELLYAPLNPKKWASLSVMESAE